MTEFVLKKTFGAGYRYFYDNNEFCKENVHRSPIFDLLNTACAFGIGSSIRECVEGAQ